MTDRTINILHVLNYSLPYISGYCTRSHSILTAQQRAGMEVTALTSPRHREMFPESREKERIDSVTYLRSPEQTQFPARGNSLFRARAFMQAVERQVEEAARTIRPSIIHAHSPSLCGIPAQKVAHRMGIPFVYEVRALWEDAAVDQGTMRRWSWKYLLSRHAETGLLKRSDAVVVLCSPLREDLARRTGLNEKIYVVPNGVDATRFWPRKRNHELAAALGVKDNVVVGFIGTFFTFEGLDDLVRAWDGIVAQHSKARLLLVGYGELAGTLERLREGSNAPETIIMTGRIPHNNILDYYSIIDIMVYPRKSLRLTELVTPLKPLEAMAMGKAVIASDVGGLRELIEHEKTGLLFRAGERGGLTEAVLALLHDGGRRETLGARAARHTKEEKTWSNIVKRYQRLYTALLEPV